MHTFIVIIICFNDILIKIDWHESSLFEMVIKQYFYVEYNFLMSIYE